MRARAHACNFFWLAAARLPVHPFLYPRAGGEGSHVNIEAEEARKALRNALKKGKAAAEAAAAGGAAAAPSPAAAAGPTWRDRIAARSGGKSLGGKVDIGNAYMFPTLGGQAAAGAAPVRSRNTWASLTVGGEDEVVPAAAAAADADAPVSAAAAPFRAVGEADLVLGAAGAALCECEEDMQSAVRKILGVRFARV